MSSTQTSDIRNRLLVGDARAVIQRVSNSLVDCVVTSPPYYRLRDYHHSGQIGHEPDVQG